jgi:hypothetical protein
VLGEHQRSPTARGGGVAPPAPAPTGARCGTFLQVQATGIPCAAATIAIAVTVPLAHSTST